MRRVEKMKARENMVERQKEGRSYKEQDLRKIRDIQRSHSDLVL